MQNEQPAKQNNILVIGGAGYVGSRIIPALKEAGHRVAVLDLLWFGDHLPPDVPVIRMDAMDATEHLFKGYDTVIFLAGLSNDPMAEFDARTNFISNAPTPAYCAMLAKKAGVKRFIYASSCSVYGSSRSGVKSMEDEHDEFTQSHYGVSKLMGEVGAMQYNDLTFEVVALRMGTISGYSPRMRFDLLLNTMYMKAATEGTIDVRNPELRRPVFAMSDVVEAYQWALTCHPGVYNVFSSNTTVGMAANTVRVFFKQTYNREIVVHEQQLADPRDYEASNLKATQAGFVAKGGVVSILKELHERIGLDGNFEDDAGYNIRVFTKMS